MTVAAQRLTVAIVDDDLHLRESIKDLLETADLHGVLYDSATSFLEEKGHLNADCILADVKMPGMSGLEMLSRLSEIDDRPPVVIMTSYLDEKTETAARNSGAAAFLGKPVSTDKLLASLHEAISRNGKPRSR